MYMKARFPVHFVFFFFLIIVNRAIAQAELQKLTPLSPNAAEMVKYGQIPMGYFTGIPSIGLPVYTIQSKELSLPLSLSYHAGGNKVEDIASWVGLGWSLSTIPSISRSVNGLPDEVAGGYFGKYYGLTVGKIADSAFVDGNFKNNYLQALSDGATDPEADIFRYTLANKSGKFWWDQERGVFQTSPWRNIKIASFPDGLSITDEDGTIYEFGFAETSGTGSDLNPVTWWASKMYSANRTDSLTFSYDHEMQLTHRLNPVRGFFAGSGCTDNTPVFSNTVTNAWTISSIIFNSGYVNFKKSTTSRADLDGGHTLDSIEVYNYKDELINKYKFNYTYRSATDGSVCTGASSHDTKRLMLAGFIEASTDNRQKEHGFLYDSAILTPCRISPAQDYWGFYNGAIGNSNLVPTANAIVPGAGPVQLTGADRSVHPEYSQFSILKRIVYPTGGYTDFEFENNQAYNNDVPMNYIRASAMLTGDGITPVSATATYKDTFVINNPANYYLNGTNGGGAFADINFGELGCSIAGGGNPCAQLFLRQLGPGATVNTTITTSWDNLYLPNGTYEIEISFNQIPPQYENYYYIIAWDELDSIQNPVNKYVGGLRAKSIKSFDALGNSINTQYRYTTSLVSDTSSGDVFGLPYFINNEDFTCIHYISGGWTEEYSYRIAAVNNATAVSHSGSFVGYKTVYESTDSSNSNGLTEYRFSHAKDVVSNVSPFPPPFSTEEFRGELLSSTIYKKNGSQYWPVSKTIQEYKQKTFDSLVSISMKARLTRPSIYNGSTLTHFPVYDHNIYELIPQRSDLSKKTTYTYDQFDTTLKTITVEEYEYSGTHYNLTQTKMVNSKDEVITTKNYYPEDLSLSGDAEQARLKLILQNQKNVPLKIERWSGTDHISTVVTNFKKFNTEQIVLPAEIFVKQGSGSLESRVKFLSYGVDGRLHEQQKTGDVLETYIWGYKSQYPVAKITGKTYSDMVSLSSISLSVVNNPTTDAALKTELDKLYTVSGSFVNSYRYKPLIGITCETDLNGRNTYYEYDGFNRLWRILDHDLKVIKVIDYQFRKSITD